MNETLALKYRPQSFGDMVGQELVSRVLHRMVEHGKVPTGLLFSGIHGTGKTSAARILGRALNPGLDEPPVLELDAASNGGVADIRALIDSLRYGTFGTRVVILDEAHSLSRDAFNALLKTLEDPPANTHFVLVTTEPNRLPDTVLSRLITFEFRKISPDEIGSMLASICFHEGLTMEDDLLQHIATRVDGSMRDAIMSLDQCALADIHTLAEYQSLSRELDWGPRLLANLTTGDPSKYFEVMDRALRSNGNSSVLFDALVDTLRDLMVLKAGGSLTVTGPAFENRKAIAATLNADQLVECIRVLWDLKTRFRFRESNPSDMAMALVLLSEVLGGSRS